MVAYCADYRVRSRHETSPFEAVADAKAAVRWIWRNAGRQGVDPKKIVSAGGSAGGHLAACSGLVAGHDEVKDGEPAFIPAAMVLFNPVIDTSKKGYGYAKLKERYLELSPVEHVHDKTAPTLVLVGSADTTTPVTGHKLFEARMKEKKRSCRLIIFQGQKHGFFNARGDNENYWGTLAGMEQFLGDLNYIRMPGR
jgi:acetyl esterase/lipase